MLWKTGASGKLQMCVYRCICKAENVQIGGGNWVRSLGADAPSYEMSPPLGAQQEGTVVAVGDSGLRRRSHFGNGDSGRVAEQERKLEERIQYAKGQFWKSLWRKKL
jgi:hypothetical protein